MSTVIKLDSFVGTVFYYMEDTNEIKASKVKEILDIVTNIIHKDNKIYAIVYNNKELLDKEDIIIEGNTHDGKSLNDFKYVLVNDDRDCLLDYVDEVNEDARDIISKLDLDVIVNGKRNEPSIKEKKKTIYPYLHSGSIRRVIERTTIYELERYVNETDTYLDIVLKSKSNSKLIDAMIQNQEEQLDNIRKECDDKINGYSFELCNYAPSKKLTKKRKDK